MRLKVLAVEESITKYLKGEGSFVLSFLLHGYSASVLAQAVLFRVYVKMCSE